MAPSMTASRSVPGIHLGHAGVDGLRATASATSRDTSSAWMGGKRTPAARRSSSTWLARARAATRNISLGDARASATIAPRPTPGKMKTLLAWPMRARCHETGAKGLPVATMARPSLHAACRPACLHSTRRVGERQMMGSWVARPSPGRPPRRTHRLSGRADEHVGLDRAMTSHERSWSSPRAPGPARCRARPGTATSRLNSSRSVRPWWTRPESRGARAWVDVAR